MVFAASATVRDSFDPDAQTYIDAVEAADTEPLEAEVRRAIVRFVKGCKHDGIWDAVKASCVLAGARTLTGALVPLVGTAPTNFNFVSGDYNRKTGLKGNGSNKYLNSNRANNADLQNNQHMAVYATTLGAVATGYIGSGAGATAGISQIYVSTGNIFASRSQTSTLYSGSTQATGLLGISRSASGSYSARNNGSTATPTTTSQTPNTANIILYNIPTISYYSAARLSFYSIGEALDLEKLDNRVTALMNAFDTYIP